MGSQVKKWIVRDGKGHIFGPFDLAKLKELMGRSLLTGDEEAAEYPAGDWAPMSTYKELYDMVLATLMEASQKPDPDPDPDPDPVGPGARDEKPSEKSSAVRMISITGSESKVEIESIQKTKIFNRKPTTIGHGGPASPAEPPGHRDPTRILRPKKKSLVPFFFMLAAGVLLLYGKIKPQSPSRKSINLIMPRPKGANDMAHSAALVKEGWAHFYKDTISEYIKAEEVFVEAVETAPQNAEASVMLAFTDFQIWPVVKQDSFDQNVLSTLIQITSQADRGGSKRALVTAAADLMLGHENSGNSQIDSALRAQAGDGRLYALRADSYYNSSDCGRASGYYNQAEGLLPYWVKPVYMLGVCAAQRGLAAEAQDLLLRALKMNPDHKAARIELGILEARNGRDADAKKELSAALDSNERLVPSVESRGRFHLAIVLDRGGDRSGAKSQAQAAFALNPADVDIRDFLTRIGAPTPENVGNDKEDLALGDQYMRAGDYLGAQSHFKAAFLRNPHNARAAMKAAQALWKLHQSVGAMDYLNKSIIADPKFVESYVLLSDYKSQRFDFQGAVRALEAAVKVAPNSYVVFRGYAEVFLRKGDPQSAEAYVARGLKLYDQDVDANLVMAKVKVLEKDPQAALQYAKKAIELDRTNIEAQIGYARVLANYQGVKAAVEYLNDLINTYPTLMEYRIALGDILLSDEQFTAAKSVLSQVVAASHDSKEAYMLLGDAAYALNDLAGAQENYLAAARIDPSDPAALFRLGELYLKAGKPEDAKKQFEFVLRVNPLFPRTHYDMARAEQAAGLPENSVKELEEEKRLNPKLADSYEYEGDIFLLTRKFAPAVGQYQKAIELRPPQNANLYVKIARAYRLQGGYDQADSMLRQAKVVESGNSEIYKEYGWLYVAKNMPDYAVEAFEKYLRLEPNSPDKQQIEDKINEIK